MNIFNQKNGDISSSSGQNFYRILHQKIRLKKVTRKNAHAKGQFRQRLSKIDCLNFLSVYFTHSLIFSIVPPHRGRYLPPKRGESFGDIFSSIRWLIHHDSFGFVSHEKSKMDFRSLPVHSFWPILIQILYWSFSHQPFGFIWYHLRAI